MDIVGVVGVCVVAAGSSGSLREKGEYSGRYFVTLGGEVLDNGLSAVGHVFDGQPLRASVACPLDQEEASSSGRLDV